jgi:hypothetical protein
MLGVGQYTVNGTFTPIPYLLQCDLGNYMYMVMIL